MVVEDDDDDDDNDDDEDEWELDELKESTDKASASVAMAESWNKTYFIKIVSSFVVLILSKSKLWPNQR